MKIEFLKDYRNFKKGNVFEVSPNTINFWVGKNGTGKSTLASLILTALESKNKKLVPNHLWMATQTDKKIISLEGYEKFNGLTFVSDKLRQAQLTDMDSLLGMGLQRIWTSEGQNAQADVVQLAKIIHKPDHLTILDETDGHLDYSSKIIFFEALLKNIKGTVIVISHDSRFLKAQRVFDFGDMKEKIGEAYYNQSYLELIKNSPDSKSAEVLKQRLENI
jgi:ATPase subunit of ABC transporter with duplicated ATPase domains